VRWGWSVWVREGRGRGLWVGAEMVTVVWMRGVDAGRGRGGSMWLEGEGGRQRHGAEVCQWGQFLRSTCCIRLRPKFVFTDPLEAKSEPFGFPGSQLGESGRE